MLLCTHKSSFLCPVGLFLLIIYRKLEVGNYHLLIISSLSSSQIQIIQQRIAVHIISPTSFTEERRGNMANISVLNDVHNFYMTTYANKTNTPYDTHKKSELRSVYNSIVKMNKEAPLYLLDNTQETREYAVGIKETARGLSNTIASLGGMDDESVLNKKTAYSSDENTATADFVGQYSEGAPIPTFELSVKALASNQVNMGRFLPNNESIALPADTYSFDVGINDLNYEFQFNINSSDTNKDVQDRLARLINNSNIGLKASVIPNDEDGTSSYLKIESDNTGLKDGSPTIFTLSDEHTSKATGAIDYLGISYMTRGASDAVFSINGEEHTSASNSFSVGKMYDITLKGISTEESPNTTIGLKTDVESLTENISTLVRGYNNFIKAANEYTSNHPKSTQLVSEMSRIARYHAGGLTTSGVNLNLDGTLELDEEAFQEAATNEDAANNLSALKDFTKAILGKSNQVSLNPMQYVDKTIVAYKNPGKNYASPYITSAYSGMLFNSYC